MENALVKLGSVLAGKAMGLPADYEIVIDIAYATANNFTAKPVYSKPHAWLHHEALAALTRAAAYADGLGYRLQILDVFRPTEAQWKLWNHTPDPNFIADPNKGSPHSRGVAVDLTLLQPRVDGKWNAIDMGTAFDAFTPKSFHGDFSISAEAQRNRLILLGIMTSAGFDFYRNEWWHYQLYNARSYPLISDTELPESMMN